MHAAPGTDGHDDRSTHWAGHGRRSTVCWTRAPSCIGGERGRTTRSSTLDATINWDTDQTRTSTPGAPPNGSDFVRVRDAIGRLPEREAQSTSIVFDGATSNCRRCPLAWDGRRRSAGQAGPIRPCTRATGDNLDRAIVRQVDVPPGRRSSSFDAAWSLEDGFDYGYVQVSTDGGATATRPIPCYATRSTGRSARRTTVRIRRVPPRDLRPVGVRRTNGGARLPVWSRTPTSTSTGFWVDDVAVDGTVLSDGSTLERVELTHGVQPDRRRGIHGSSRRLRDAQPPRTWTRTSVCWVDTATAPRP